MVLKDIASGKALSMGVACVLLLASSTVPGAPPLGTEARPLERVVVVMLENRDAEEVYGNASAPYLNALMERYAYATHFMDVLPMNLPSEPHYIWLEAGTNAFLDHTFTTDADASEKNSTASAKHLAALLEQKGIDWVAYEQGLDTARTGACPVHSSGLYAAKHDPFIFFQDVSGKTPSEANAACAQHHRPTSALSKDLAKGPLPRYVLITPDLCHDMHGAVACPFGLEPAADLWLKDHLPGIIASTLANRGVVLVAWDEGDRTLHLPFLVISDHLKSAGFANPAPLNLSSVTRGLQDILGVSPRQGVKYLGAAADAPDLSSFFAPGTYP